MAKLLLRLWLTSIAGASVFAAVGCSRDGEPSQVTEPANTPNDSPTPSASPAPPAQREPSAAGSGANARPPGATPPADPPKSPAPGSNAANAAGATAPMPASAGAPAPARDPAPVAANVEPALFFLNNLGQVIRAADDGSARRVIVADAGSGPDGIAVDVKTRKVYWTNMGRPDADDGSVMSADLDGRNVATVVKAGGTFTPKQLKLDAEHGKLYWSDREGMRVMRVNVDGTQLETLVQTGDRAADRGDAERWCVGIAVDVAGGKLYWTQKGSDNGNVGTINRVNLELPAGADPSKRPDIEVLFANLPEPIDLDLDLDERWLYWTDRGDNTVSRAPLDPPPGFDPSARKDREILVRGLREAIGITLDVQRERMFYTSLGGDVEAAAIDGAMPKKVLTGQGALTGIVLVDLPE